MLPWEKDWTVESNPWDKDWNVPETTAGSLGKTAAASAAKGVMNIAGLAGDVTSGPLDAFAQWLAQKMTGRSAADVKTAADTQVLPWLPNNVLPTSAGMRTTLEKVTGPLYDPQTRTEKVVDTAVQLGVGLGKPSVAGLTKVVAPVTAGTEVAGALTDDNPLARMGGGLGAGGFAAALNAYTGIPANTIRQAIGEITPEQLKAALAAQAQARKQGIPLMGAESLPNSGIQQLASDVMASRTGAPVTRKFLDQRPDQVRTAVGGLLDDLGPRTTPDQTSQAAQKAATQAIAALTKERSKLTGPMYDAAATDQVPAAQLEAMFKDVRKQMPAVDPDYAKALNDFLGDLSKKKPAVPASAMLDASGRPVTAAIPERMVPKTEVAPLSSTYVKTREQLGLPSIQATPQDRIAQGILGPFNRQLGTILEDNSAQWKDANAAYKQFTTERINPVRAGPVGRVAGEGFTAADVEPIKRITGAISDAQTARPETIRELYSHLNKQDTAAFPAMARTWLENAFDQATKRVQQGENVKLGANFANDVRGTDQQRANIQEVMRGVAQANGKNPDVLVKGTDVLLETLAATGKIPGIGSQTAGRLGTQSELSRNPVSALADIVSTRPLAMMGRGADSLFNARRNRIVAEWLTAPDSVEIITKMAKLKPDSTTAKFYLLQLLNSNKELSASAQ